MDFPTFGSFAARLLLDWYQGGRSSDHRLFDFDYWNRGQVIDDREVKKGTGVISRTKKETGIVSNGGPGK
jgi:hypothetical protein